MKPIPVIDRGPLRRWYFTRRAATALRRKAEAEFPTLPDALEYLEGLQRRMTESGQEFHLVPGHAIVERAVKVERRRVGEIAR